MFYMFSKTILKNSFQKQVPNITLARVLKNLFLLSEFSVFCILNVFQKKKIENVFLVFENRKQFS